MLHDNALTHKSKTLSDFLATKYHVTENLNSPVLADLASCGFWLSQKLKFSTKEKCSNMISDIQQALTVILETILKNKFQEYLNNFVTTSSIKLTQKESILNKRHRKVIPIIEFNFPSVTFPMGHTVYDPENKY